MPERFERDVSAERQAFRAAINRQRRALGFPSALHFRLDNLGLHEGRVVSLDYGQMWRPIEVAWSWVLRRLEEGALVLDQGERERFYADVERELEEMGSYPVPRQSLLWLAARAGVRPVPRTRARAAQRTPMGAAPPTAG